MTLNIILIVIAAYFFLIFVVARLIIPHLGWKETVPKKIPADMQDQIKKIKKKAKTKKAFLKAAYNSISKRHPGSKVCTYFWFRYVFRDITSLWKEPHALPCNMSSFMMHTFLRKSGLFRNKDIKIKTTMANFNIHRYLQVYDGGKWVDIDVWGKRYGIPFGKHGWGFV